MPKRKFTNLLLYRRRILIGYLFVFAALVISLALAATIPGGVTPAEKASVVRAMALSGLDVNAPYYYLQKAAISLFGMSTLSIKLPSLLIGIVFGTSLFLLLRRWLSLAIAVFSALIIFAGTTFITLVGLGDPLILYALYPTLLIYLGTRVLAHDRGLITCAILLVATGALALLTPSMIYLAALALGLALFNPHVRYGFRRLPAIGLVLLFVSSVVALAPLVILLIRHPGALGSILALPSALSLGGIGANLAILWKLFGRFLHPSVTEALIAPIVGLATAGLAVLGAYRIARGIYTARAQFIIGWSVIAALLALLNTQNAILLYLPIVLLASIGLGQLAAIWYRTFPLNPYARVVALVPIGILITGIVLGSTFRYINTTQYAQGSVELYSHDLALVQDNAARIFPNGPVILLVPDKDLAFYSGTTKVGKVSGQTAIKSVQSVSQASKTDGPVISTSMINSRGAPFRILTDGRAKSADRFYVYK